jgi:hypothetical protein
MCEPRLWCCGREKHDADADGFRAARVFVGVWFVAGESQDIPLFEMVNLAEDSD